MNFYNQIKRQLIPFKMQAFELKEQFNLKRKPKTREVIFLPFQQETSKLIGHDAY